MAELYKEFLFLKIELFAMDDALESQFDDGDYADKKKDKKGELIQRYQSLGKLD